MEKQAVALTPTLRSLLLMLRKVEIETIKSKSLTEQNRRLIVGLANLLDVEAETKTGNA